MLDDGVRNKNESVLKVENLRKSFGKYEVIKGVSFELRRSEILGLLGPNGAGKTTILHMLLGLIRPLSGSINIFGMDMNLHRERILKRMNFSSTYIALPFSLTVSEALNLFARLYSVRDRRQRIDELVEQFELKEVYNREIRTLSSGQQTRLNLAKSLINSPEILLLDEPTASMDPDVAQRTREYLKRIIKSKNTSIIYTSHNMYEMQQVSDRIIFLNEGRIVAEGTADEIISLYKGTNLEDVFLKIARSDDGEG